MQYEGSDEKHYTYTIITTDSNKQLSFLHDRMPVILENGSNQIRTWLDPNRSEWSKDLQLLLKPFQGELDCYPVSKDVGKVGNNSPTFIVPVASTENKNNIANFFSNAKTFTKGEKEKKQIQIGEEEVKEKGSVVKQEKGEARKTVDCASTEDNAPMPVPVTESPHLGTTKSGLKREHDSNDDDESGVEVLKTVGLKEESKSEDQGGPGVKTLTNATSTKPPVQTQNKKRRSATKNDTVKHSPAQSNEGSQKITSFYK